MAKEKSMSELQDIIQRLRLKHSIKLIHRETKFHKTVIRKTRDFAIAHNFLDELRPLPTEQEIEAAQNINALFKSHPLDAFQDEIVKYVEKELTFVAIHRLINDRYNCDESTIRKYLHRKFPKVTKHIVLRTHIPGEVMDVDFGSFGMTYNPETKRMAKTYFFSARLKYSRHTYREVVFNQYQETFFMCHIHAFEYFGGVPEKVTPDNLKAAVIQASFQETLVNRVYRQLALHYGFLISPTLPYTPEHKGGVENDVKYVKRNFFAVFKEQQLQKGRADINAKDLADELEKWNREIADIRIVSGVGRSPADLFECDEKQKMKILPLSRWDITRWKECKAEDDYRVRFEKSFYSVPYQYHGQKVSVCSNSQTVRIYKGFTEIAMHERSKRQYQHVVKDEHRPPNELEYLKSTSTGLLRWAEHIGESVKTVVDKIFEDKSVDGIRSVRALLFLEKKYSPDQLVQACNRILHYGMTNYYRDAKSILEKKKESLPLENPAATTNQLKFKFSRGGSDYVLISKI